MAIITLPSIVAQSATMELIRGDGALEFFDGSQVGVQSTKAVWVMTFPLKPLKLADARPWQAAMVQLAKVSNQFEITPPNWVSGTGYSGGQPLVAGASQLGLSLDCDGADNNTTIALAGDYISVAGEMKMLIANADSDGAGLVTFDFEPAVRSSPLNNDPVEILSPIVTMRFANFKASWSSSLIHHRMGISAIEYYSPQ